MKKITLITCLSLFIFFNCKNLNFNIDRILKKNLFNNNKKGTIIAKVDKTPVSLQEIREEMRFSLGFEFSEKDVERMMGNPDIQKNYEDKIINQYLIIKKFLNDKTYNSEEFNRYLLISVKETIVKYYLYKNFFTIPENKKWKEVLITDDQEVLAFYNENKKFFDDKKIDKKDALSAIKTDLEKRKSDLFFYELTESQKKLINDLKEKYKVEKNLN